jgi:hypothetical protein
VLRLIVAGEPSAQATVSVWKKADKGGHSTASEFRELIGKIPGWEPGDTATEGEVPAAEGRWVYRWSAKGKQDGSAVVQTFYLIAGPNGEQVTIGILSDEAKAAKLAEREAELLGGVTFPEKK